MNQIRQMLQTKYPYINQYKVVKALYKKFCKVSKENQNHKPIQDIEKKANIQLQKMDFQNTKFLKEAAKVYVKHGYGLQIARRYLQEEIQPNRYNNSITRLVRQCWKAIQVRMHTLRHKSALKTSEFNLIKTPLVNGRTWMGKQVLATYHSYIYFSLGMQERPSDERTIQLYEKVLSTMKKNKYTSKEKDLSQKKYNKFDNFYKNSFDNKQDEGIRKITMMVKQALRKQRNL